MGTQTSKGGFPFSLFRARLLLTSFIAPFFTVPLFFIVPLINGGIVHAQVCGGDHVVIEGESLSKIAESAYGDAQKWTVLYNVNLDAIGDNPNLIFIDQVLRIPCLEENNEPVLVEQVEETLSNDDDTISENNAAETASTTASTDTVSTE